MLPPAHSPIKLFGVPISSTWPFTTPGDGTLGVGTFCGGTHGVRGLSSRRYVLGFSGRDSSLDESIFERRAPFW